MDFQWAPKIDPSKIRRLYEMDAMGIQDEDLVEVVGYALLARCESIYRVTERLCPDCGGALMGAWESEDRDRIIACPACGWESTWRRYHKSYQRRRLHGGRAFAFFKTYLDRFPACTTARQKILEIDKLLHEVHISIDKRWTLPAAVNLIKGKSEDVAALLDSLAYGDDMPWEHKKKRANFFQKLRDSEEPTRRHAEWIRERQHKSN